MEDVLKEVMFSVGSFKVFICLFCFMVLKGTIS